MAGVYESVHALSMSGTVPPDFVRSAHDQPGPNAFRGDSGPEAPPPPVIDMSRPECGALMADAATEWGLFQVVNHGVPAAVLLELQRVGRAFFALSREEKEQHCTGSGSSGYPATGSIEGYGIGITGPRGSSRDLEGKKNWEDYLFHYVAPPTVVNHDIWPKNPAGYRYIHVYTVRAQSLAICFP
jgi:flavonol synthase